MGLLAELKKIGNDYRSCGHESYVNHYIFRPDLGVERYGLIDEDWEFLCLEFGIPRDGTKAFQICSKCAAKIPSEQAKAKKRDIGYKRATIDDLEDQAEKLKELIDDGAVIYLCPHCEKFVDESDLVQARQCPNCEEQGGQSVFNGTENGRNCPECNRPFTRNLGDNACPECVDCGDWDDGDECEGIDPDDLETRLADVQAQLKSARSALKEVNDDDGVHRDPK